jgi:hydroxyacylglutathione hydrolase
MFMKIRTLKVGVLKSNCYLAIHEKSNECLIIDPGDDGDYIQRVVADEGVKPIAIIATHGHFDHILAAYELQAAYNIPFMIHKEDEFLLNRMQSSATHFTGVNNPPPPPKIDKYLVPGELEIRNYKPARAGELKIIPTPGHTPGGISLYFKKEKTVFVGDLIFDGGHVGRTDFAYSSSVDLQKSIQKIKKLPSGMTIYPGHGIAFTNH